MASGSDEPEFNAGRAELFEALGHPIRIRILQALEERPMGKQWTPLLPPD
jgi:DNA-binding transcriptional ArsR family regulator